MPDRDNLGLNLQSREEPIKMTPQTIQLTIKDLGFISDPALERILRSILEEIDRVYLAEGYRSTLYLSISAVEGVLNHVINLNASLAQPLTKRAISNLKLADLIKLCSSLGLIPSELEKTYEELRKSRNFIHPEAELKAKKSIHIGLCQLAMGILNTTLKELETKRFIDGTIWSVVSGRPTYLLLNKQLKLEFVHFPTESNIMTENLKSKDFQISFDLTIPPNSILNFIYNIESDERFWMARLDTRSPSDDGVLICFNKFQWHTKQRFVVSPQIINNKCLVNISFVEGVFSFSVDNVPLQVVGGNWNFDPSKPAGFFNECSTVNLENFSIKII